MRRRWLQRWLSGRPSGGGFESTRYLAKWLLLGVVIGAAAGLGAVVFSWGIDAVTRLALGGVAGYVPPAPVGEGATVLRPVGRPWVLPLVLALGGLLSGLLVFHLAPEAEGHGTDAVIQAIHHRAGRIRPRIPPVKLVASALTIGTGGSGGREGPAAQISAGIGSLLATWLRLEPHDRRIAVAAGMGAGIGAIFRAPLGGALMAAEILYRHDLEVEALIPALVAGIVGYTIYGGYHGFAPIFGPHPGLALERPIQLVYYGILGLACGLVGILYAKAFYGAAGIFRRMRMPRWLTPAVGGLLVGFLGLVVPGALHMGYGWLQLAMGTTLLDLPLWMVVVLPFAKILATALSIGSGGSGGVFGPGMVVGGMVGAAFWRLAHATLPAVPAQPAAFVIIGMMALFGGIAHAPLAVMLMVAEMTGNLSLLAPAMVAVAISTALVGDHTIYRNQLPHRASAPAHRLRFSFPLLSSLQVRDAVVHRGPVVGPETLLFAAERWFDGERRALAVVDAQGRLVGVLTAGALRGVAPEARKTTRVGDVVRPPAVVLAPEVPLDEALERLVEADGWAPVVAGGRLRGELRVRDVVAAYRQALRQGVRRATELPATTVLVAVRVGAHSPLIGRTLAEAGLPAGVLVVAINRDGEMIFPRATTTIEAGDELTIVADPDSERMLRVQLGADPLAPDG